MSKTILLMAAAMLGQPGDDPNGEQPRMWRQPWGYPHPVVVECGEHAKAQGLNGPFVRYVIMPYADQVLLDWHVWTVNMAASDLRNTEVLLPLAIDPEGLWVAWDLARLAPRVIREDDKLRFDVIRLMGAFEGIKDLSLQAELVEPIEVEVATIDSTGVLVTAPVKRNRLLDGQYAGTDLLTATQATTPIVTLGEFTWQLLSEDYYNFLGIKGELNEVLLANGWDVANSRELLAVARALTAYSFITRAQRGIEFIPGQGNRVDKNAGIYMRSIDFLRAQASFFNAKNDLFQNQLNDAGSNFGEHIWQGANGRYVYVLSQGPDIIKKAAANAVIDELTTHGELETAISCIGCHLQGEIRGIQPIRKDFKKLMEGNIKTLVQLLNKDGDAATAYQLEQQLLSLYNWENEIPTPEGKLVEAKFIRDARNDFSDFCVKCTGALENPSRPGLQPEDLGEITREFWNEYVVNPVTPYKACIELGLDPGDNPEEVLQTRLMPAFPENAFAVLPAYGRLVNRIQWQEAKRQLYPRLRAEQPQPLKEDENEEADNPDADGADGNAADDAGS